MSEVKVGDEAVEHLLRHWLDPIVLGETQILGQMRDAFFLRHSNNWYNFYFLNRLLLSLKRRIMDADNAVSVSYAAVELAKKVFGKLKGKQTIIIGAGEMSELSLLNLLGSGIDDITVVNRTETNAYKFNEARRKL